MSGCYLYILETEKIHSLYTGISDNFCRRLKQHITGKGAKHTLVNGVYCIRLILCLENKSEAMKLEKKLKKKTRKQKEAFINLDENLLQTKNWISVFRYQNPMSKEEEKVCDILPPINWWASIDRT
jgi:putative endonuclease